MPGQQWLCCQQQAVLLSAAAAAVLGGGSGTSSNGIILHVHGCVMQGSTSSCVLDDNQPVTAAVGVRSLAGHGELQHARLAHGAGSAVVQDCVIAACA